MSSLTQLLKQAKGQYSRRKAAAESAVVRWEFCSRTAYDPRPYYFERYQQKRGRRVARASAKSSQYGFDADGRCRVAREPKTTDSPAYEEFFEYRGANVESAAYRAGSKNALMYAAQQKHAGGNIVACDVLDVGPQQQQVCERYRYSAGRLKDIKITESCNGESNEYRFDVLYDKAGRMIAIRKFYDYLDRYLPIYWNADTAPSFDDMWKQISQQLVELIPKAIGKRELSSPAYCLAITYDTGSDELPPGVALGLESELRQRAASSDKPQKQAAWNPKLFRKFRPGSLSSPKNESLNQLCDLFLQYSYSKSDLASPRNVLSEVALALNRRNWSKQFAVTKDFVVFVTDLDDELREMYWRRDLKASLPPAKLKKLQQQKLV